MSATVAVGTEASAAAVAADVGAAAAGGRSGAASVGAAATVRAGHADVSASANVRGDGPDGPRAALEVTVDVRATPQVSRPAVEAPDPEAPAPAPRANAENRDGAKAKSKGAPTRAKRNRAAAHSVTRPLAEAIAQASLSPQAPLDLERTAARPGGGVDSNTGGPSPEVAVPSAGGVSSAATLLSLAILLIPLVGWAIEHTAAGSPKSFLVSLLGRPG